MKLLVIHFFVGTETRLWVKELRNRGFIAGRTKIFFSFPYNPEKLMGPAVSYPMATCGSFPGWKITGP